MTTFTLRPMQPGDLPGALRLSQAERWPHRLEDWAFHFRLGQGWAAVDGTGGIIGTALWWDCGGRLATTGLILVDRACQGRGIGRQLMDAVLRDCGRRSIQLVATQAGLKLYRQCGFVERSEIAQHQGTVAAGAALPGAQGFSIRDVTAADAAMLRALDGAAFGGDRGPLIDAILEGAGGGVLAQREAAPVGFALVRQSGRGTVIGPVIAADESVAMTLIAHELRRVQGFARLDVPADAAELGRWLESVGLARVDRGTIMLRGEAPPRSTGTRIFGLVSQALN